MIIQTAKDDNRCKQSRVSGVWSRQRRCHRQSVRDGYCKQHHPDSVKVREQKSELRRNERNKLIALSYLKYVPTDVLLSELRRRKELGNSF